MTRILTTHVGSLPRPAGLIRTTFAKQDVAWAKLAALREGAELA
jgi:methionine synthase II (cobalamin-independent)